MQKVSSTRAVSFVYVPDCAQSGSNGQHSCTAAILCNTIRTLRAPKIPKTSLFMKANPDKLRLSSQLSAYSEIFSPIFVRRGIARLPCISDIYVKQRYVALKGAHVCDKSALEQHSCGEVFNRWDRNECQIQNPTRRIHLQHVRNKTISYQACAPLWLSFIENKVAEQFQVRDRHRESL
jgi:hypothetical protein